MLDMPSKHYQETMRRINSGRVGPSATRIRHRLGLNKKKKKIAKYIPPVV